MLYFYVPGIVCVLCMLIPWFVYNCLCFYSQIPSIFSTLFPAKNLISGELSLPPIVFSYEQCAFASVFL